MIYVIGCQLCFCRKYLGQDAALPGVAAEDIECDAFAL